MKTKKFHISDVLSVTTGRLVSTRRIGGVYDILNFMTGDDVCSHQIPRAIDECKPYLLEQFPQLDSPQMQFALGKLIEMLKTPNGKQEPDKLILGWISKLTSGKYNVQCGEILEVKPLPRSAHAVKDPIEEVAEMMGGQKKVIIVTAE